MLEKHGGIPGIALLQDFIVKINRSKSLRPDEIIVDDWCNETHQTLTKEH